MAKKYWYPDETYKLMQEVRGLVETAKTLPQTPSGQTTVRQSNRNTLKTVVDQDDGYTSYQDTLRRINGRLSGLQGASPAQQPGAFSQRTSDTQSRLTAAQNRVNDLVSRRGAIAQNIQSLQDRVNTSLVGTRLRNSLLEELENSKKRVSDLDELIRQAQNPVNDLQAELYWSRYYDQASNPDFETKSQYATTRTGQQQQNLLATAAAAVNREGRGPVYRDYGYADPLYDWINGDDDAGDIVRSGQWNPGYADGSAAGGYLDRVAGGSREVQQMTGEEKQIFNYLYRLDEDAGDREHNRAYQYLSDIQSDLTARDREEEEKAARANADENPFWASAATVLSGPERVRTYIGQAADIADDGKIDQNAAYNQASYINSAVRDQVASHYGPVGSFLYQTGMSMADFLFNTVMTGGFTGEAFLGGAQTAQRLALGIMGTEAAADSVIAAKDRGLSDGQSFALGTISGMAEILTEKVSIEALFSRQWEQNALKYVIKNMLSEGGEEVESDAINWLADVLIAKDKSEWMKSIAAYREEGKTPGQALGLAVRDQAMQMGLSFLGGAFSGGFMSGGNVVLSGGARNFNRNAREADAESRLRKLSDDYDRSSIVLANRVFDLSENASKLSREAWEQQWNLAREYGKLGMSEQEAAGMGTLDGLSESEIAVAMHDGQRIAGTAGTQQQTAAAEAEQQEAEATEATADNLKAVDEAAEPVDENAENVIEPQESVIEPQEPAIEQPESAVEQRVLATEETSSRQREAEAAPVSGQRQETEIPPAEERAATRSVMDRAETLGENGSRQFRAIMQETGEQNARDIYDGYEAVYNAEINKRSMTAAESALAANIPVEIREQARAAAQADTTQTVRHQNPGLLQDDTFRKAKMKRSESRVLNALGIITGTQIRFADEVKTENGTDANAVYDRSTGTITISLTAEDPALTAAVHEVVHRIRNSSPGAYQSLARFVQTNMGESWMRAKSAYAESYGSDSDTVSEEVVADAFGVLMGREDILEQFVRDNRSAAQKFFDAIHDLIVQLQRTLGRSNVATSAEDSAAFSKLWSSMSEMERLLGNALEAYDQNPPGQTEIVLERVGIDYDAETESVNPNRYSRKTWNESEYVTRRNEAAKEMASVLGITQKKAKAYIDAVNGIAAIIAGDQMRLDYTDSGLSSLVSNAEYGGSIDFNTNCKKRRLMAGTFQEIQRALNKTALSMIDILDIRNMMIAKGYEVSCGLCYVEGSRSQMGKFSKKFIELYARDHSDGWIPDMFDVNTPDGVEAMRTEHPEAYAEYERFWNNHGKLKPTDKNLFASQQKPKLYQSRSAYRGEILNEFRRTNKDEQKKIVNAKNTNGGLRMQSFSDFEIVHLIDCMQAIMDMSAVGLAGQAYTKVPDFAWALGGTGLKINLSLIAKGVDANGNLILDEREGMKKADAEALRNKFPENVGTIVVAFNEEQLAAAMKDEFIDFIIPFHRSQITKGVYHLLGLPEKTKDFTYMQNEKFIKKTYHEYRGRQVLDKAKNLAPNSYWNFRKSGKENAEEYLRICKEGNRRPKFYKLLVDNGDGSYSLQPDGSTDGYWKLLIDFKMYDNNGKGAPQRPVRPEFQMDQAKRMLDEYAGGANTLPVAWDIVDEFLQKKTGSTTKASVKGARKSLADAERANERLRGRVEYLAGQMKLTRGVKFDEKSVRTVAADLIRDYKSAANVNELAEKLRSLYTDAANNKITPAQMEQQATEVADMLSVGVDDEMYQAYEDLRKYLRGTTFRISTEDAAGIPDFNDFKKRNLGRVRIGGGTTNIDTFYQELQEQWPEFFNEDIQSNVEDQLLRIVEVADTIYNVKNIRLTDAYGEAVVTDIAVDAMSRMERLLPAKPTFADKAKQREADALLAGRMAQGREDAAAARKQSERLNEKLEQSRQRRDADVKRLTESARQREADALLAGRMAQGREDAAAARKQSERLERSHQRERDELLAGWMAQGRESEAKVRRLKDLVNLTQQKRGEDIKNIRESQKSREIRAKIMRHASAMSKRLLNPTDSSNIPEELRKSVAAVLGAINLESRYDTVTNPDGSTRRVERRTDPMAQATKRTEAFARLQREYDAILREGDMVADPDIDNMFKEISELRDTPIAAMNSEQLEMVWNLLKSVETTVANRGKMLAQSKFRTIIQLADAVRRDSVARKRKDRGGILQTILDENADPYTYFYMLGNAGRSIFRTLADARDQEQTFKTALAAEVSNIMDTKEFGRFVKQTEEQTHEFDIDGTKLTMTTAQIMELHNLWKQGDARAHILSGGIGVRDDNAKNKRETKAVRVTEEQVNDILRTLDKEEYRRAKDVADKLQGIMAGYLADIGNEASMKVYGYKKFKNQSYWSIHVLRSVLQVNPETNELNTKSIRNVGIAKNRIEGAKGGLDIGSAFDTFAQHSGTMIRYAAWLAPMEDMNRLYNFRYKDSNGDYDGENMRSVLTNSIGGFAGKYWENLMNDIQNGVHDSMDTSTEAKIMQVVNKTRGAAVGLNIRVVLQQPTAIMRAAFAIDPKYLAAGVAKGATPGSGWRKALKWAPIAQIKDGTGFDISATRNMRSALFGVRSAMDQFADISGAAATKADAVTWGKIWNACELQTRATRGNLDVGTEEFYKETAKLFTEVIDQTQVVDGVLQRSALMRSSGMLNRAATVFKGEPTKTWNMFARAVYSYRHSEGSAKKAAAVNLTKTAFVLMANGILNAVAQSIADGWRDDDKHKNYWQRVVAALTGAPSEQEGAAAKVKSAVLVGNLGTNLFLPANIPYINDAISLLQGWDVSRVDAEVIKDIINSSNQLMKAFNGKGYRTTWYASEKMAAELAKVTGISVGNLFRDAWGISRTLMQASGNIDGLYTMERAMYAMNSGTLSRYADLAAIAMANGDSETFGRIVSDLKDNVGEDKVTSRITTAIKNEYEDGGITSNQAIRYLKANGLEQEDAESKVNVWSFRKENPQFEANDATEAAINAYRTNGEPFDVSVDMFMDFWEFQREAEADKDEDGKSINGSKKAKVVAYIDSLPLSWQQKDALYLTQYSESTLDDAPW